MSAVTLTTYTEEDVIAWLGEAEVAKGRPYVDLVQELDVEDERVRAIVPGSSRQPYTSIARLVQHKRMG